jgi:hypothetical protein
VARYWSRDRAVRRAGVVEWFTWRWGAASALAVGGCIVLITAGSSATTARLLTTDVYKYAAWDRLQRLAGRRLKRLKTPLQ